MRRAAAGTVNSRFRPGVPRRVSYAPQLYHGWIGITMEEWRTIVVLRRPELYLLEATAPVPSKDWDAECMGPDRGGAVGLQHLPFLSLPRIRALWGLSGYECVRQRTGSVLKRYVPWWWTPSPDEYEHVEGMPAGALTPALVY